MLVSGAFAGFVAGLFGIGGGIILMPALMYGFDQLGYSRMFTTHLSIGTSLAIIAPTTAYTAWTYYKHGSGDINTFSRLAIPAASGSLFGSWLAGGLSGNVLRIIFAVLIMLIALNLFKKNHFVFGSKLPASYITWNVIGLIGMFSAMMGISGGLFFTAFLVAYGFSLLNAIGTSVALGLTVSLPGTVGYILSGLGNTKPKATDVPIAFKREKPYATRNVVKNKPPLIPIIAENIPISPIALQVMYEAGNLLPNTK